MTRIIQVNKGDFTAFAYEGDVAARPTPKRLTLPAEPTTPDEFIANWGPRGDVPSLLTAWYMSQNIPFVFLDIGSNIGADAVRIAKLSAALDRRFPIIAFEPGVNAALLPYTLELNSVQDRVRFEEMCVSDSNKPTILFGETGRSTNNRIVNRNEGTEGICKLVRSTTVGDYLARPALKNRHPIAKIDVQGAEWLIWLGMKEVAQARHFTFVMEFTPWAISSFVGPTRFLLSLKEACNLFDLGYDRSRCTPIEDIPTFLRSIGKPRHWTDILCVSRSLPSADALVNRIRRAHDVASRPKAPGDSASRELTGRCPLG